MVSSMKYALEVGVRRYLGSRWRLAKCRSVEASTHVRAHLKCP
jgi:hypothetical protein